MKTSSAGKGLSRTAARNSALLNLLATPGLGSIMAKRYIAGTGQLLLALIGAGLGISWFIALMVQMVAQINGTGAPKSIAWIGETGAAVFA
ncbi:MAG TPA: hypothetical protein VL793_16390, partial [Patescibacteria group bacterium]|nr:hypothetical protein [Patescibacteria group bacterium]